MKISGKRQPKNSFAMFATLLSLAAIPFMAFMAFTGETRRLVTHHSDLYEPWEDRGTLWFTATVIMTAIIIAMITAIVFDATVNRHARSSRADGSHTFRYRMSVAVCLFVWSFGGFYATLIFLFEGDCGSAAAAPCLDRPGPLLVMLCKACIIAPTLLLPVVFIVGRFSRACVGIAPSLILSIYLLAIHLVIPHMGFGAIAG